MYLNSWKAPSLFSDKDVLDIVEGITKRQAKIRRAPLNSVGKREMIMKKRT